jgi:hypothetical protein
MLLPPHLLLSAVAAFNNCQLAAQFTSSEHLKQVEAQWAVLFQQAQGMCAPRDFGYVWIKAFGGLC